MLKTYHGISRFMDGLSVNYSLDFVYLKDQTGVERIGGASIHWMDGKSHLFLRDITSKKTLAFEGDHLASTEEQAPFSWFPSVKEVGVLHDDFDNEGQRRADMVHNYQGFLRNELFFEAARQQGTIVGEHERDRLMHQLSEAAFMYGHSLGLLYAGLNGNGDVLLMHQRPLCILSGTDIHNLDIGEAKYPLNVGEIDLDGNLEGFLELNPEVKAHLTDGELSVSGIKYDTPEKIMERLRRYIPEEVLEAGYQQFKAEREATGRLAAIRAANPRETLDEQMKEVDVEGNPVRISLGFAQEDLARLS